jgi:hypothetical protein
MSTLALVTALALSSEPGFVSAAPPEPADADVAPRAAPARSSPAAAADASTGAVELELLPTEPVAVGPGAAAGAAPPTAATPPVAAPIPPATGATPGVAAPPLASAAGGAELPPDVLLDASASVDLVDSKAVRVQAHVLVRVDEAAGRVASAPASSPRDLQLVAGLLDTVHQAFGTVSRAAAAGLPPGGAAAQPSDAQPSDAQPSAASPPPAAAAPSPGDAQPRAGSPPQTATVLSRTDTAVDTTVERVLEPNGRIVERTLDGNGTLLAESVVGSAAVLPVVSQSVNAAGETVLTVRDRSGTPIDVVLGPTGAVLSARVANAAPPHM